MSGHSKELPRYDHSLDLITRLSSLPRKIRIALIGMGSMGRGLFHQCRITPGVNCVAVSDIHEQKILSFLNGTKENIKIVDSVNSLEDAVRQGKTAVCRDGRLPAQAGSVDILVESSSSISEAGAYVLTALDHHKHVVMMNSEADLIFGPLFLHKAERNGVVYTSCGGDQHTVLSRLLRDILLWGFEPVLAGNIKGFLDRYANPTTIIAEADKREQDYRMCTSYTDGTKLSIEMSLLANSFGFWTQRPGMTGPRANHVREVYRLFDLEKMKRENKGFVDYVLGAEPNGGVFLVGYCDNSYQRKMMAYYKMGEGPFFLFYRPYHLCHVEAMESIVKSFLDGEALLQPRASFKTNVFAYAKKDLREGERLDGVGGYTCYGLIENMPEKNEASGLPVCLCESVRLKRNIKKDDKIFLSDVLVEPNNEGFRLYSQALDVPNMKETCV